MENKPCKNSNLDGFIDKINQNFLNLNGPHLKLLKSMFIFIDQIETLRKADLQKHGFSEGRMMVLITLWFHQHKMNSSEVAQHIGVTRATMTGLVDGLEKDSYIQKVHCKEDRRVQYLELTDKGHQFLNTIIPEHFGCWKNFTQELDNKDAEEMSLLFDKLFSVMKTSFDCKN